MYGFKGTDKDMKCRDFQYTLQKRYIYEGKIELCNSGFHLCKDLNDVFSHYALFYDNRYFVVEYGGQSIEGDDKIVSDTITFLEEITSEFILNDRLEIYNLSKNTNTNLNALLYWSIGNNHLEIVKYLVSKGADIKGRNNFGIRLASINGHLEIVEYLTSLGADIKADDNEAVRWASEYGHLEVVKYLVSLGADITAMDNYAIRWSSTDGHLEVVEYLVSQGADFTAMNNRAIKGASRNGHSEIVEYLVSQGADINVCFE